MDDGGLTEALDKFGLAEHAAAIQAKGVVSLAALLRVSDDDVEMVHDLLEDEGAKKQARRDFRKWLAHQRTQAADGPPPESESVHFYGLADSMNDKDTTGVEAATILRVDIDPFTKDKDGKPRSTLRMAPGAVERQVQAAADGPVPVVSLIGPTGVGKSFITSFFLPRGSPRSTWPVVAHADQFVPTSANVCLHRGVLQPSAQQQEPILLIDFEGEDGRIPQNLQDGSLKRLASYLSLGLTKDELKSKMNSTMEQRQHVVKHVLPPLAFLISDIVVFVDQVEPRRTERKERIMQFAEQAHKAVESLPWQPVLILLQNKWARGATEKARYDVTEEYDWITDDLGRIFSRVVILRIPVAGDRHKFEDGILALHRAVHTAALEVRATRQGSVTLYTEPEFWFGFETLVEQLSQRGVAEISGSESLSDAMSRKLASRSAADNAKAALRFLGGEPPKDPGEFQRRVREVLGWYAYGLAGQAWFHGDTERTRGELQNIYNKVTESFQALEPCASRLNHDGMSHPCTQRRAGHQATHRNPAFLEVTSKSTLKRWFLFKDKVPCIWRGSFDGRGGGMSFGDFAREFDRYTQGMQKDEYEAVFAGTPAAKKLAEYRSRADSGNVCLLCLCVAEDLTLLPDPVCHHYLCRKCILVRKKLSKTENEIICPFCARKSVLPSRPEIEQLRVLTLDGGGVRGLVVVHVLQRVKERFEPLPLTSLFDLVAGTGTGGWISMGLLAREPLERLNAFLEAWASKVLDVSSAMWAWRRFMDEPVCSTSALRGVLNDLFQGKRLEDYRDSLPYCCCAAYNKTGNKTLVAGNFPKDLSSRFDHQFGGIMRDVGHATAATPTFFEAHPQRFRYTYYDDRGTERENVKTRLIVDGGIEASCPVKLAARAAEELQTRKMAAKGASMEMLVSIGTGRQPATPNTPSDNVFHWDDRVVDMAMDAEKQWEDFLQESQAVREVPKVRVNPPNLGAEAAFSSGSVPRIHQGMNGYFESAEGKDAMDKLFNLTYAKLWQVKDLFTLVAGSAPAEVRICTRDLRFQVEDFDREALVKFALARRSPSAAAAEKELEKTATKELREMACKDFEQQPLHKPLPGHFAVIVDGEDRPLEAGVTTFMLATPAQEGMPLVNVVWRTARSGDFPISGFPRLVQVIANKKVIASEK